MAMKKTKFSKTGLENVPNDKPILYKIQTASGKTNYAGIAQRGRAQERLTEHLGNIPGSTVQIEQFNSIDDARAKEKRVIKRSQPKYNDQDK